MHGVTPLPEIARTKGGLGRISLSLGRYEDAGTLLTEARSVFLTLYMPEEAGLAGLELVEVFIALGDEFRAMAVVEEVVADSGVRLNGCVATALAYLREMVSSRCGQSGARRGHSFVFRSSAAPAAKIEAVPPSVSSRTERAPARTKRTPSRCERPLGRSVLPPRGRGRSPARRERTPAHSMVSARRSR